MAIKKVKKTKFVGVTCDICGTEWHSSSRSEGDVCGNIVGKKTCKGICR